VNLEFFKQLVAEAEPEFKVMPYQQSLINRVQHGELLTTLNLHAFTLCKFLHYMYPTGKEDEIFFMRIDYPYHHGWQLGSRVEKISFDDGAKEHNIDSLVEEVLQEAIFYRLDVTYIEFLRKEYIDFIFPQNKIAGVG
jgi:hypothetical protein